ncbi:hypothetical protein CPB84DRAFT_1781426 [Gymnopilus junonius]|uniref:FK506-binding protein n=1 Tax=Gymnopilus junonius TaxID=109634 RepID=A0A9P5NJ25_GYMJU|nr:hypothetical protein CPB84DRAFT_1781426 [Gymnopilus junonius]
MSIVLGLWHLTLEGGQQKTISSPAHVRITNVSLGEKIADQGRTVVKLTFEPPIKGTGSDSEDDEDENEDIPLETTVLCALTPGKIEHATIDVTLDSEAPFALSATGKNKVYLTGNYIKQMDDAEPSDSEGYSTSDDEDAYDLREVSSDVEMHPDDLDGIESNGSRFEEIEEEPAKPSKRPRESDVTREQKTGSASKKNKKLKAEGGKAVSAPSDTDATLKAEKQEKKKKDNKVEGTEKGQKDQEDQEKKEKKVGKGDKSTAKKTIAGGVVIEDVKVGTGSQAKKGNTVRMRYIGKLTNGKVFDKNTSGKPFTFHLGKGEVIKGWDEGIVGMQVGGERVLSIPANMAYGSKKQEGIPANSNLVFEVKLLEIK